MCKSLSFQIIKNSINKNTEEKKIKIISENTVIPWWSKDDNLNVIKKVDRDGNKYYKTVGKDKWVVIPSIKGCQDGYEEGYGSTIEKAYCNLVGVENISDIPDRLTI